MDNFFFDNRVGYLCYVPTQGDIVKAEKLFQSSYKNNSLNSKTVYDRKESRIAGLLGEIAFSHYYEGRCDYVGKGNVPYDFVVHGDNRHSVNVDVKCKYRRVQPKPNFEASIYNYQCGNFFKDVDYYAFLSTSGSYEKVWFCGMINKTDLLCNPNTILWKAGQVDPTNGKVFHEDTLSIFYKYLTPFQ